MHRVCFTLKVRTDRMEEYAERHAAVWPEMLRALHDTGWPTTPSSCARTACSSATSRPLTSPPPRKAWPAPT